jgi:HD-like signal output (HDOD) protein
VAPASEVEALSALVSPPHICLRVAELVASPDSSARAIGEVIGQDPSLTARLLRLVNSSFYGYRAPIDSVARAVAVVGHRAVHTLAVAVSAVKSFSDIPNDLVNMDTFWRHGVYCGLIARDLAGRLHSLQTERLFVAGLLHDIGSLILYRSRPDASREVLLVAGGDEALVHQAELETLGFSHAGLGGRLLARWGLPDVVCEAVACHHTPGEARVAPAEAAILHVAEALANRSRIGAFSEDAAAQSPIDPLAWEVLGIPVPDELGDALITEAGQRFLDTASLVCPTPASTRARSHAL